MATYQVKTSWWIRDLLFCRFTWRMPDTNAVYLTFDDGPHTRITPYVLDQLEKYNAKASFFCIGNNVKNNPGIYIDIINKGHTVGNHTYSHLNGWFTKTETYIRNIRRASVYIDSTIFRPPYGKIKRGQANRLLHKNLSWKVYMWDVLSGDFDLDITPEKCLENVINNIEPGSIIVFHDSEKAWERMSYALPKVLEYCKEKNWQMKALPKD